MRRTLLALPLTLFLCAAGFPGPALAQPAAKKSADKKKPGAIPGYTRRTVQGFTLLIHEDVLKHDRDPKWKRRPLAVLDLELGTIARSLPARTVKALRTVVVWVEWEDSDDPDFGRLVAKYYGVFGSTALWSLAKYKHPLKANSVEVIDMHSLTREHQPGLKFERCILLHEMCHVVHFRVFGVRNPHIQLAYKQAMARKLYDTSKDVYGRAIKPYAARNEREYFAELSCAYLDKLHYFPFNPDDLKEHDPVGYRMMELTWGKRKQLDKLLRPRLEREAADKLAAARRLVAGGKKKEAAEALEALLAVYPKTKAAAGAKELLAGIKE
jgi:hypothetical protein